MQLLKSNILISLVSLVMRQCINILKRWRKFMYYIQVSADELLFLFLLCNFALSIQILRYLRSFRICNFCLQEMDIYHQRTREGSPGSSEYWNVNLIIERSFCLILTVFFFHLIYFLDCGSPMHKLSGSWLCSGAYTSSYQLTNFPGYRCFSFKLIFLNSIGWKF